MLKGGLIVAEMSCNALQNITLGIISNRRQSPKLCAREITHSSSNHDTRVDKETNGHADRNGTTTPETENYLERHASLGVGAAAELGNRSLLRRGRCLGLFPPER